MDSLSMIGTVVGIIAGIGGLALGIFNFVGNRREHQRRVAVKLDDSGFIIGEATKLMVVAALNKGFSAVILQQAGVKLPDGRVLTIPLPVRGIRFPYQLLPGDSCDFLMPMHDLAHAVKKAGYGAGVQLRGYFRDGLGTVYTSAPLRFDPDTWIADDEQIDEDETTGL